MAVTQTQLEQLYLAYFGRPADPSGLAYYTASNLDIWGVAAAFSASPESQALYGAGFSAQVINNIYNNLFNRDAEPAGILYWTQQVASGKLTAAGAAYGILLGAQNADLTTVNNKLAVSAAFTAAIDTTPEILAYAGDAAAQAARTFLKGVTSDPASVTTAEANINNELLEIQAIGGVPQTFSLTVGVDTLTGSSSGHNTFNAVADPVSGQNQLSALDNINGGSASTNVMNVVDPNRNAEYNNVTVKNIQTLNVNAGEGLWNQSTNDYARLDKWAGLQTINATISGNDGAIMAAATTDVNVTQSGNNNLDIEGGHNIVVNTDSYVTIGYGWWTGATADAIAPTGNVTVTTKNNSVDIQGDSHTGNITATTTNGEITEVGGVNQTANVDYSSGNYGNVTLSGASGNVVVAAATERGGRWGNPETISVDNGVDVSVTVTKAIAVQTYPWSGATAALTVDVGQTQDASGNYTNVPTGNVTVSVGGASDVNIDGGKNVSVTVTGQTNHGINIGGNVAATGSVTVNATDVVEQVNGWYGGTYGVAGNGSDNAVNVTGGTVITVNESVMAPTVVVSPAAIPGTTTIWEGSVNITGDASTTVVNVKEVADTTAVQQIYEAAHSASITFNSGLTAGQTVKLGGLTFTAGSAGLTQAQLMTVFSGLANGATTGPAASLGTYSGQLSGWTTSAVTGSSTSVTFTSTTAHADVANLAVSGTGAAALSVSNTAYQPAVAPVTGAVAGSVSITDANASNADGTKANTIAAVTLDGYGTADIYDNGLKTLGLANSAATVTVHDSTIIPTNTTLDVTVNNLAAGAVLNDATITTLDLHTSTKDSALVLGTAAVTSIALDGTNLVDLSGSTLTALKTVTVTGAAGLKDTTDFAALANLKTVTSSSSGAITIDIAAAQSFVSTGSGKDVITVEGVPTATETGGTGTSDEIILDNAGSITEAALSKVSGFETLGLNGNTYGTFDMSKAAGYTSFDIEGTGAGNVTITNAAQNSSLTIGANVNASTIITLQTADSTGSADVANVTIGSASNTSAITVNQLTLEDSQFAGTGTVNITSNDKTAGGANTITTLGDTGLQNLTVTGTGGLTIGTLIDAKSSLTINNNNGGTAGNVITTLTANSLSTLNITGSNTLTITTLNDSGSSLTINDSDTAAVAITNLAVSSTALTSATFATTAGGSLSLNNGVALTETKLATLNLTGDVAIAITGDTVTTGITVNGGTDNADVSFTSTGATAAGKTDSITLGNGNDTVVLGAGVAVGATTAASTQVVTLGNGVDSVTSSSMGDITITVGNGAGDSVSLTGGTNPKSTQTVTMGTGAADTFASSSVGTVNLTMGTHKTGTNTVTLSGVGVTGNVHLGDGDTTVTANGAGDTLTLTGGNGNETVSATGAGDKLTITLGNGNDSITANGGGNTDAITLGTGADTVVLGSGDKGTVTFGAHTGTDAITVGTSGTSLTKIIAISGLANAGTDTITFSGEGTIAGMVHLTAAEVAASSTSADTTNIASWVAAADGLGNGNTGAMPVAGADTIVWFQFQGNTYLYDTVAGGAADNGAGAAGNTLVELVGTGYTFAHTTFTGNTVNLLG